jgi:hypothetical protein
MPLKDIESQSIADTIMAMQGQIGAGYQKGQEDKISLAEYLAEQDKDPETPYYSSMDAIKAFGDKNNMEAVVKEITAPDGTRAFVVDKWNPIKKSGNDIEYKEPTPEQIKKYGLVVTSFDNKTGQFKWGRPFKGYKPESLRGQIESYLGQQETQLERVGNKIRAMAKLAKDQPITMEIIEKYSKNQNVRKMINKYVKIESDISDKITKLDELIGKRTTGNKITNIQEQQPQQLEGDIRNEAIQALQEAGAPITEANITAAIQQLHGE